MRYVWSIGILWFVALSAPGGVEESSDRCRLFAKVAPQQLVRPTREFLKSHGGEYTYEVPEREVRNQCSTQGCWAFQTVANIEREVQLATGKQRRFSEAWLILHAVKENALRAMENPREMIKGEGNAPKAYHLIDKYGLVPGTWKPRVNIYESGQMSRLTDLVNQRLAQYHMENLRDPTQSAAHRESAQRDIEEILSVYLGRPPRIRSGLKTFSPVEWASRYVEPKKLWHVFPPAVPTPPELAPKIQLDRKVRSKKHKARKELEVDGEPLPEADWSGRTSWERIDEYIIHSLKNGKTVSLSYENAPQYTDNQTGVMSIAAFPAPKGMERPLSRPEREAFGLEGGNHAVEIIGVEVKDGEIVKLKVRNSYGPTRGDNGHYHMYRDYFREYMRVLSVREDYLPPSKKNK